MPVSFSPRAMKACRDRKKVSKRRTPINSMTLSGQRTRLAKSRSTSRPNSTSSATSARQDAVKSGAPQDGVMDKVAKLKKPTNGRSAARAIESIDRPSRAVAEEAVRTLIRWSGDDPQREGLVGTPARVVRAYEEWFSGYFEDPREYLRRTFEEVGGYDEIVVLRDIRFESHCEHHIAPIIGRVHIGYLPRHRVIGISKLARLVDVYARRLQVQEKMTAEIAGCLNSVLKPFGVGVVVEGAHECMTTRGVHKSDVTMVTSCMLGTFRTRPETRQEFLSAITLKGSASSGNAIR